MRGLERKAWLWWLMASSWCGSVHAAEPVGNVPPPVAAPVSSVPRVRLRTLDGCPSEAYLFDAIERLLRRPLDTPRREVISVEAELQMGPDGAYEVTVRAVVDGHPSERRLSHRDCVKLTDAAALMMAMAIDADAVSSASQPPPVNPQSGATPSLEGPVTSPLSVPLPVSPSKGSSRRVRLVRGSVAANEVRSWSLSVSALGQAAAGPLPDVAGAVGLLLSGFERHGWGAGVWGRILSAQSVSVPGYDARIQLSPMGFGARGCWFPQREALRLGLCVGPELVSVKSDPSGVSFTSSRVERATYWEALAQATAEYALMSPVRAGVQLEFGVVPRSPRIGLEEGGEWRQVARPSGWIAGMGLTLAVDLY